MKANDDMPGVTASPFGLGLRAYFGTLADFFFPWQCVLCGDEGPQLSGPLCPLCRAELLNSASVAQPFCPRCALPVGPFSSVREGCVNCRGHSLGFDQTFALGLYEGPIRHLCLLLKQERNAWLAPWLISLLIEARHVQLSALPSATWVVPVPLHWRRHLVRGYNQARALGSELSRKLHLKMPQPLRRVRSTGHLKGMSSKERIKAMRGAFKVRSDRVIKGRDILLVDDVLTTGATCGAAARALKQAGARHVTVAVVGRTV